MNVKVSDEVVMAEGLHTLDIVWLEERVLALEAALQSAEGELPTCADPRCPIIDGYDQWCCAKGVIRATLDEGDASGG